MNDPAVVALAGAIVTLAGIFYRHLLQEKAKADSEAVYWRNRYFGVLGRTELAADEAARRNDDVQ